MSSHGTATTSARDHGKPLVLLVHGTWGRSSTWIAPESKLRGFLGDQVDFCAFRWSGRNSARERLRASVELRNRIDEFRAVRSVPIYVIAHSHGGNIAYNAVTGMPHEANADIICFFLGTPFVVSRGRYEFSTILEHFPAFIKDNPGFLMFGLWVIFQFFGPYSDILTRGGGTLSLSQFSVFLLWFFLPMLAYAWLEKAFIEPIREQANASSESETRRGGSLRLIVINYSTDEAITVLSVLTGVLTLAQQIIFFAMRSTGHIMTSMRVPQLAFQTVVLALGIAMIGGVTIAFFVGPLVGVLEAWGAGNGKYSALLHSAFVWFQEMCNVAGALLFTIVIVVGVLLALILSVLIAFGLARTLILSLAGVADQVVNRRAFWQLVFGEIMVAPLPPGRCVAHTLEGRRFFSHTAIYDDDRVLHVIGKLILKEVSR